MATITFEQTVNTPKRQWCSPWHRRVRHQSEGEPALPTVRSWCKTTMMMTSTQTVDTPKRQWCSPWHRRIGRQSDGGPALYTQVGRSARRWWSRSIHRWIIDQCGGVYCPSQSVVNQRWWPGLSPSTVYYWGQNPAAMGGYEPTVIGLL